MAELLLVRILLRLIVHSIEFDLTRHICGQSSRERLLKRTRLKRAQYRVYGVREAEAGRDEVP